MPADPVLLVLDTATDTVHLGLSAGPGRVWTRALPGGAAASAGLLPAVQALLADAGLRLADLDALGVGRGPGAFTGVRTACAVAQGLALGLGCPVLLLDSLRAVAEDAWPRDAGLPPGTPVWVAVDARMGEVYACAQARDAEGCWQTQAEPALHAPADLAAELAAAGPAVHVAGNSLGVHAAAWAAWPGAGDPARSRPEAQPRAAALLRLAAQAWTEGAAVDPALALPRYVRDKVAQTTAERAAAVARPPDPAGASAAAPTPAPASAVLAATREAPAA